MQGRIRTPNFLLINKVNLIPKIKMPYNSKTIKIIKIIKQISTIKSARTIKEIIKIMTRLSAPRNNKILTTNTDNRISLILRVCKAIKHNPICQILRATKILHKDNIKTIVNWKIIYLVKV